ncbi:hypothetical protein AQUCO_03800178v1 [Aquilegia coerulea]|uniref:Legume lectin domain-containing protein n=1 Tax=Aquilegia coerulea TaxID=218851 RepID=A0A2G5CSX9_AQUCA|nr:hypothetical protein AQUCO_03800178v1 [Aquilegia coerulea]
MLVYGCFGVVFVMAANIKPASENQSSKIIYNVVVSLQINLEAFAKVHWENNNQASHVIQCIMVGCNEKATRILADAQRFIAASLNPQDWCTIPSKNVDFAKIFWYTLSSSTICTILPPTNPTQVRITRFDLGSNEIVYEGSARPSVGAVEFNSLTYYSQVGRATYANPVQIWDSKTGKLSDFTTHFTFTIDTQGSPLYKYGAGLAFFLAPIGFPIPPNSAGGFLGLFNTTTSDATTQNHIVLVEFDTFPNSEWDPPDVAQHIGINVNSIHSASYLAWNASLYSDQRSDAWVTYNASTKNLSVLLTYSNSSSNQDSYYVSHIVDLTKILPEWVTVGFSATTNYFIKRNLLNF